MDLGEAAIGQGQKHTVVHGFYKDFLQGSANEHAHSLGSVENSMSSGAMLSSSLDQV